MLRALALSLAVALLVPVAAHAAPTSWKIEPNHSSAHFKIKHLAISSVRGSFSPVTGTVVIDDEHPEKSTVEASIPMASVNTDNSTRDDHLKSADFFDVTKFPTMTFKSTSIEKAKDGYKLHGNLTLHGVTKEVVLDMDAPSAAQKNPVGSMVRGISATTTINRKDFGLTWNKAIEGGGLLVGEDVKIELDIEVFQPAADKPADKK